VTVSLLALGWLSRHHADDNGVTFDVAVTDRNNNPVVGLEKRHFKVFLDGVEQTITSLSASSRPLAAVFLLEYSDTILYYEDNVIAPATGFVNSFQSKDWIGLVSFDVRPEIVTDFTRDKSALFAGLRGLQMPFYQEAALYDALDFVLEQLEEVEEKTAILLFSTGLDTISRHNYSEILRTAETSDTIIYSIGMSQFAKDVPEAFGEFSIDIGLLQADNVMRSLAEASGGLSFFPRFSGEYRSIYETVNGDLRHQYTVGFISTNSKAGGEPRKLKVEVVDTDIDHDGKADKLKIRHKKQLEPAAWQEIIDMAPRSSVDWPNRAVPRLR
jgi:VWFA-related protein